MHPSRALAVTGALLIVGCTGSAPPRSEAEANLLPAPGTSPHSAAAAPRRVSREVLFAPETPLALLAPGETVIHLGTRPRAVGSGEPDFGDYDDGSFLPPIPPPPGVVPAAEEIPADFLPVFAEEPLPEEGEWVEDGDWAEEEEVWIDEEVRIVEVPYYETIEVPVETTVAFGTPVLVVSGYRTWGWGRFPAVNSASCYDPCRFPRRGAWWTSGYDPHWNPCFDPGWGSWKAWDTACRPDVITVDMDGSERLHGDRWGRDGYSGAYAGGGGGTGHGRGGTLVGTSKTPTDTVLLGGNRTVFPEAPARVPERGSHGPGYDPAKASGWTGSTASAPRAGIGGPVTSTPSGTAPDPRRPGTLVGYAPPLPNLRETETRGPRTIVAGIGSVAGDRSGTTIRRDPPRSRRDESAPAPVYEPPAVRREPVRAETPSNFGAPPVRNESGPRSRDRGEDDGGRASRARRSDPAPRAEPTRSEPRGERPSPVREPSRVSAPRSADPPSRREPDRASPARSTPAPAPAASPRSGGGGGSFGRPPAEAPPPAPAPRQGRGR